MTARETLVLPLAGFLGEPAGAIRRIAVAEATIALDDELVLARPISATLELSRTNRGLFLDGFVAAGLHLECSRCLEPTMVDLAARIREEVLPAVDMATGRALDPSLEPDVARLSEHHELDLGPLLREAISLSAPIAPLCATDCPGLCIDCGERLGPGHPLHIGDDVDPRMAALRGFPVDADAENG